MKEAAKRLGWIFLPGPSLFETHSVLTIYGSLGGVPVRLTRSVSGDRFETMAFLEQPLPFEFSIGLEGFGDRLAHVAGMHDVAIGDAQFDATFKLRTSEPERLKLLLGSGLQQMVETLHATTASMGVTELEVTALGVNITRAERYVSADRIVLDVPIAVNATRQLAEAARTMRDAVSLPYR